MRARRRFGLTVLGLAALALLPGTAGRASAGVLYGLSSGVPGTVFTINEATGAATPVVNLTGTDFTSLVDLAARNGTLYASDVFPSGGPASFGRIDLATGAFTPINNQGGSMNWHALAYNPAVDRFYAVAVGVAGDPFLSVTPAGAITTIGPTNHDIRGMTFDSNHNILYGVTGTDLYTINPATGAATLVGPTFLTNDRPRLAYDTETDVLYLNLGGGPGGNALYRLDPNTGRATRVGPNGPTAGAGIDGIAFVPTAGPPAPDPGAPTPAAADAPEPSSLALFGLGTAGLAGWRWRRKQRGA